MQIPSWPMRPGTLEGTDLLPMAPMEAPAAAVGTSAAMSVSEAPKGGFGEVLNQFVSDVNGKMNASETEKARLLAGENTNLHQTMISMQEASTAFSLMVEVRNKLVEGYQELMRIQI